MSSTVALSPTCGSSVEMTLFRVCMSDCYFSYSTVEAVQRLLPANGRGQPNAGSEHAQKYRQSLSLASQGAGQG